MKKQLTVCIIVTAERKSDAGRLYRVYGVCAFVFGCLYSIIRQKKCKGVMLYKAFDSFFAGTQVRMKNVEKLFRVFQNLSEKLRHKRYEFCFFSAELLG